MKKKNMLAMALSLAMVMSMTACGSSSTQTTTAAAEEAAEEATTAVAEAAETTEEAATEAASAEEAETEAAEAASGDLEKPERPVATAVKGADEYDQTQVGTHDFVYGHTSTPESTQTLMGELFDQLLQEKSDGKMTCTTYDSSQLGTDNSLLADIQSGSVDFYATSQVTYASVIPEAGIFDMPFLFNSTDDLKAKLIDDQTLYNDIYDIFYDNNIVLFPFSHQGFREISSNKEITGIDSFNGLKLRTTSNEVHMYFWEQLGVACTPLNTNELYLALQQNMVDGQENPWSQIYDKGLYDVQKYVTNSNHVPYLQTFVMSRNIYDGLNETEQQIVFDAASEMMDIITDYSDSYENYCLNLLQQEYGMTFIDFDSIDGLRDALREKTYEPTYHKIAEMIGDTTLLDEYLTVCGYEIPQ